MRTLLLALLHFSIEYAVSRGVETRRGNVNTAGIIVSNEDLKHFNDLSNAVPVSVLKKYTSTPLGPEAPHPCKIYRLISMDDKDSASLGGSLRRKNKNWYGVIKALADLRCSHTDYYDKNTSNTGMSYNNCHKPQAQRNVFTTSDKIPGVRVTDAASGAPSTYQSPYMGEAYSPFPTTSFDALGSYDNSYASNALKTITTSIQPYKDRGAHLEITNNRKDLMLQTKVLLYLSLTVCESQMSGILYQHSTTCAQVANRLYEVPAEVGIWHIFDKVKPQPSAFGGKYRLAWEEFVLTMFSPRHITEHNSYGSWSKFTLQFGRPECKTNKEHSCGHRGIFNPSTYWVPRIVFGDYGSSTSTYGPMCLVRGQHDGNPINNNQPFYWGACPDSSPDKDLRCVENVAESDCPANTKTTGSIAYKNAATKPCLYSFSMQPSQFVKRVACKGVPVGVTCDSKGKANNKKPLFYKLDERYFPVELCAKASAMSLRDEYAHICESLQEPCKAGQVVSKTSYDQNGFQKVWSYKCPPSRHAKSASTKLVTKSINAASIVRLNSAKCTSPMRRPMCKGAAIALSMPFKSSVNSNQYPYGCGYTTTANEAVCPNSNKGCVFFNTASNLTAVATEKVQALCHRSTEPPGPEIPYELKRFTHCPLSRSLAMEECKNLPWSYKVRLGLFATKFQANPKEDNYLPYGFPHGCFVWDPSLRVRLNTHTQVIYWNNNIKNAQKTAADAFTHVRYVICRRAGERSVSNNDFSFSTVTTNNLESSVTLADCNRIAKGVYNQAAAHHFQASTGPWVKPCHICKALFGKAPSKCFYDSSRHKLMWNSVTDANLLGKCSQHVRCVSKIHSLTGWTPPVPKLAFMSVSNGAQGCLHPIITAKECMASFKLSATPATVPSTTSGSRRLFGGRSSAAVPPPPPPPPPPLPPATSDFTVTEETLTNRPYGCYAQINNYPIPPTIHLNVGHTTAAAKNLAHKQKCSSSSTQFNCVCKGRDKEDNYGYTGGAMTKHINSGQSCESADMHTILSRRDCAIAAYAHKESSKGLFKFQTPPRRQNNAESEVTLQTTNTKPKGCYVKARTGKEERWDTIYLNTYAGSDAPSCTPSSAAGGHLGCLCSRHAQVAISHSVETELGCMNPIISRSECLAAIQSVQSSFNGALSVKSDVSMYYGCAFKSVQDGTLDAVLNVELGTDDLNNRAKLNKCPIGYKCLCKGDTNPMTSTPGIIATYITNSVADCERGGKFSIGTAADCAAAANKLKSQLGVAAVFTLTRFDIQRKFEKTLPKGCVFNGIKNGQPELYVNTYTGTDAPACNPGMFHKGCICANSTITPVALKATQGRRLLSTETPYFSNAEQDFSNAEQDFLNAGRITDVDYTGDTRWSQRLLAVSLTSKTSTTQKTLVVPNTRPVSAKTGKEQTCDAKVAEAQKAVGVNLCNVMRRRLRPFELKPGTDGEMLSTKVSTDLHPMRVYEDQWQSGPRGTEKVWSGTQGTYGHDWEFIDPSGAAFTIVVNFRSLDFFHSEARLRIVHKYEYTDDEDVNWKVAYDSDSDASRFQYTEISGIAKESLPVTIQPDFMGNDDTDASGGNFLVRVEWTVKSAPPQSQPYKHGASFRLWTMPVRRSDWINNLNVQQRSALLRFYDPLPLFDTDESGSNKCQAYNSVHTLSTTGTTGLTALTHTNVDVSLCTHKKLDVQCGSDSSGQGGGGGNGYGYGDGAGQGEQNTGHRRLLALSRIGKSKLPSRYRRSSNGGQTMSQSQTAIGLMLSTINQRCSSRNELNCEDESSEDAPACVWHSEDDATKCVSVVDVDCMDDCREFSDYLGCREVCLEFRMKERNVWTGIDAMADVMDMGRLPDDCETYLQEMQIVPKTDNEKTEQCNTHKKLKNKHEQTRKQIVGLEQNLVDLLTEDDTDSLNQAFSIHGNDNMHQQVNCTRKQGYQELIGMDDVSNTMKFGIINEIPTTEDLQNFNYKKYKIWLFRQCYRSFLAENCDTQRAPTATTAASESEDETGPVNTGTLRLFADTNTGCNIDASFTDPDSEDATPSTIMSTPEGQLLASLKGCDALCMQRGSTTNTKTTQTVQQDTTATSAGSSARRLLSASDGAGTNTTNTTNTTVTTGLFSLSFKDAERKNSLNATVCPIGSLDTNPVLQNYSNVPRCWDAYETHMYFPEHLTLPSNAGCSKFVAQSLTVTLDASQYCANGMPKSTGFGDDQNDNINCNEKLTFQVNKNKKSEVLYFSSACMTAKKVTKQVGLEQACKSELALADKSQVCSWVNHTGISRDCTSEIPCTSLKSEFKRKGCCLSRI